ncbi:glycerol-3-phosphate dehydrogenase/oxidase [Lichenihabitans sp. PAMC28606]|uniref:glycerol-3-phosphate dehydrogenase/oxidase n=1 Tax=Lichenihabitans sp. PAMC28606 TaxID=2880932 RepID=UPI001D0A4B62|nr:glycerol-3-phosphate dehydrogenase/oxidase [Lichenihabitans sp. PAMC28606]UDL94163.1 glycerol-3-phosphate dehydrogenase/oxidase [Lichenihabitans sp. PAMC28606]
MTHPDPHAVRAGTLRRLTADPKVPVLIVGAGINGAGTFRDLALQGVDCLLVDKGDWCGGTSAAPSRLIHGGLKYLETGEFRLVAESTRERNLLLRNAPHFVKPLPTMVPIRSYAGGLLPSMKRFLGRKAKMADRGLLIVEVGLAIYDWLGRKHRVMPRHGVMLQAAARRRFPKLDPSIVAASTYYDASVTQAERLCYELVADGQKAHPGARALNHVAVTGLADGRILLADQVTGAAIAVEPTVVVNAAGPWIDQVNHAVGLNKAYIGGTKGSHLVVDNPELVRQIDGHMIYFGSSDGRICLVYPFFGRALVGSTDIKADNPDDVVCDDSEADYMLGMLGEVFPDLSVTREQIVYRYTGIRPLPAAQVDDPGEISRDHSLARDTLPGGSVPVLSMIGGKWTTFRAFSAETTDVVLGLVGRKRRRDTTFEPIGGGRDYPITPSAQRGWIAGVAAAFRIGPARAGVLLDRYGTTAEAMLASFDGSPEMPLASLPGYTEAEIRWIVRHEQVVTLDDLVFRRLPIAFSGRLDIKALTELATVAGDVLGWSIDEREAEIARVARIAEHRHSIRL